MRPPSPQLLQILYRAAFSIKSPSRNAAPVPRPFYCYKKSSSHQRRLCRPLSTAAVKHNSTASTAPTTPDRGPPSKEDTQTDFGQMDIFGPTAQPATTIDACLTAGFQLNNGTEIRNGDGVLLIGGHAFSWRPWLATSSRNRTGMLNSKGAWEVSAPEAWGILETIFPKPDLLILGLGRNVLPVGRETKERLHKLGIKIDIQDTRNAAAEFNLLATERGVNSVVAALVPIGWDSMKI